MRVLEDWRDEFRIRLLTLNGFFNLSAGGSEYHDRNTMMASGSMRMPDHIPI